LSKNVLTGLSLLWLLLSDCSLPAAIFPANPEWSIDFGGEAIGYPAHFGAIEATRGVLISLHSGQVVLVGPQGERLLGMKLDLPMETPAVAADLRANGSLSIVAVDAAGSVYCFNAKGERQWKFARAVKSGEFRLPVFADLDGDGRREIIVTDSRGGLQVLDLNGGLRLQINATKYRLSVPAIGDIDGDGKPELIFGTEGGEVYCVSSGGELVWSTVLDGCFGRALPLIADTDQDGNYEIFFPTAFNNAHPGLFALDASTGRQSWKAPSVLQSYRSTVVADLDDNAQNEILFGDKNSSLFCLDDGGRQRWRTQLPGRGIFFSPAVAILRAHGPSTAFVVVRGAGDNGKSLYAIGSAGQVLDALSLPGGGGASPILCRFQNRTDLSLLALSANGRLLCYKPQQDPAGARILWPGIRNDVFNTGFVKSSKPMLRKSAQVNLHSNVAPVNKNALGGLNRIQLPWPADAELASVKTVLPDRSVRLDLIHREQKARELNTSFNASIPGKYELDILWHAPGGRPKGATRFVYHLDRDFDEDSVQLNSLSASLKELGGQNPALHELSSYLEQTASATLEQARRTRKTADFDKLHSQCDYFGGLIRYCSQNKLSHHIMLQQLANPWENFDPVQFFKEKDNASSLTKSLNESGTLPPGRIDVSMIGNEYESAAIAVSNLRSRPATYRVWCEPFLFGSNKVDAAQILSLHHVPNVRPDGTGDLTEDPLPLLGEGQTVRSDAGETLKLWLTFRSQVLSPGTWQARLKIADLASSDAASECPVAIEVYHVRLPDRFTYRECNWLYLETIKDESVRDTTLGDALEHGMNVFVIPGVSIQVDQQGRLGQPNSETHDKLVRKLHGPVFFLVSGPVSLQWPGNTHPDPEMQDKTFADALHWYATHMRSLGCDYDDYAIYLQDEPGLLGHDAAFEAFVARVKRFKAADSRMQLYANPAGGARAELLRPLQDLIDVWAPDLHLVREQPAELTELFQHARHYWHYEAPGDQRYLNPLGFYRMKPWVAFQMGMTGGGYWVYSSSDFWQSEPGTSNEYGSVYPTDHGPVTTKRWEASRDGIEDFELLSLVRRTAKNAASPLREQALSLLEEAVQFVTRGQDKVSDISRHVRSYTPEYARWMSYRRQLIQTQMRLAAGVATTDQR
jgi:outer membrane protein assembly factor BamB